MGFVLDAGSRVALELWVAESVTLPLALFVDPGETPLDLSVGRTCPLTRVKRTLSLPGVSPLSVTVTTGSLRFGCMTRRMVTICWGCEDVVVLLPRPDTEACCWTELEVVLGTEAILGLGGSTNDDDDDDDDGFKGGASFAG